MSRQVDGWYQDAFDALAPLRFNINELRNTAFTIKDNIVTLYIQKSKLDEIDKVIAECESFFTGVKKDGN